MAHYAYEQLPHDSTDTAGYESFKHIEKGKESKPTRKRNADCDIIQFAAPIHVVDANDENPKVSMTILRLGGAKGSCSFRYCTEAGSGKPGDQYVHTEGEVTMKDGQEDTQVEIQILNDPQWNATLEFQVYLSKPVDCELGEQKLARVKVIDATVFPTNAFKEQLSDMRDGQFHNIGEFKLFWNFSKLCLSLDGVGWRTTAVMVFDQLKNAYEYMYLLLAIYMVDRVFDMKSDTATLFIPGDRLSTAYVVAGLIIVPVFFFFFLDHLVIKMGPKGKVKNFLTKSLFRKYMNYSADSQGSIPISEQVVALNQDAGSASRAFIHFISMGRLVGKIGLSIFFTLQQNPQAWWAALTFPVLMIIWGCCRTRKYITALDRFDEIDDARTRFINEILSKVSLVAAYSQRPQVNQLFAEKCDELSPHSRLKKQIVLTNEFFPKMLGPLMVAIYTAIGANLVLQGELKLGVYLATISVFGDICGAFTGMFLALMEIIKTFVCLKAICQHLNMETDLRGMLKASELKESLTTAKRKEIQRKPGDPTPRVDLLQVEICDVDYDTPNVLYGIVPSEGKAKPLFKGLNFTAPQGKIIAVAAKSGSGRRTFLQMLTMKLFPSRGTIFVPSHLRSVLVTSDVIVLKLSVWQNLVFGNHKHNNPYRIEKILKYLQLTQILSMCQEDLDQRKREFDQKETKEDSESSEEEEEDEKIEKENAICKLRETESAWIHLARAFVMNPELMVLHRPFTHFHGQSQIKMVEDALKMHRDDRGLLMDPASVNRRRPRTIIFSSDNTQAVKETADLVWVLPKEVGEECTQYWTTGEKHPQRRSLGPDDV